MEKVVVTALGQDLQAKLDSHFGRCQYLLVCDAENKKVEKAIANANAQAQGGAGVTTAQMVADMGIKTVITGNIGPKAFDALNLSGIKVLIAKPGTAADALEGFSAGKLEEVTKSSAPMHTGLGVMKKQ